MYIYIKLKNLKKKKKMKKGKKAICRYSLRNFEIYSSGIVNVLSSMFVSLFW